MRGATLGGDPAAIVAEVISIHAPHAGRDQLRVSCDHMEFNFNPRAPCGARLVGYYGDMLALCAISIHAPHAGRD